MDNKKSQVWVETAIYTLIGLTIIAIVLSIALPQIDKIKDREIVKQTTHVLNTLNSKIIETEQSPGSIRIVQFKLGKGRLEIDSENNVLKYSLEKTRLKLSEPGEDIEEGDLIIRTEEYGKRYNIYLTMDYSDSLNMTVGDEKRKETFASNVIYRLQIENVGDNAPEENIHINFNVL
ncbi:hypothetical protein GF386_05145 [Candidatus Pacearchaeota archaeon]|nr:hypothetical protein [Candidatus Pacearchaeota archaeon]MBD3283497.1 hypothetical protein [Candidatus Pacearchaeota archaeon]